MNKGQHDPAAQDSARASSGWRVGSLLGIDIYLHPSLLIIFLLIVYLLGTSVFPTWHPEWQGATGWWVAVAAAVLFFASLLAHEMAHALMGRRFGIVVKRITLFLFGGMAEMDDEPREPRAEFLVAIVGPATSLLLGLLFSSLGLYLAGPGFADLLAQDADAALAGLSPMASLLLWLGPVNTILGIFNLIPGFPLDGGRVLRAAIWWFTGDLHRATGLAAGAGRLFGWMLVILGVVQAVSGMLVQGLWLVMIGWFLSTAASTSYRMLILRDTLKGVCARDMMRSHFESVTAQMRVADFIENHLMQSSQLLWPVLEDETLIGLVTLEEVRRVAASDREAITVGQVMRTDLGALTLAPGTEAKHVLEQLGASGLPLAVVEGGRVLGLLSAADTAKWMVLHQ